jgi:hypothetical protein
MLVGMEDESTTAKAHKCGNGAELTRAKAMSRLQSIRFGTKSPPYLRRAVFWEI